MKNPENSSLDNQSAPTEIASEKKAWTDPKLEDLGEIGTVTQGPGNLGNFDGNQFGGS